MADCFYRSRKTICRNGLPFCFGVDMPNKDFTTVGCKVPIEYAEKLKETAKNKGMSMNEFVRMCIELYMSAEEDD